MKLGPYSENTLLCDLSTQAARPSSGTGRSWESQQTPGCHRTGHHYSWLYSSAPSQPLTFWLWVSHYHSACRVLPIAAQPNLQPSVSGLNELSHLGTVEAFVIFSFFGWATVCMRIQITLAAALVITSENLFIPASPGRLGVNRGCTKGRMLSRWTRTGPAWLRCRKHTSLMQNTPNWKDCGLIKSFSPLFLSNSRGAGLLIRNAFSCKTRALWR